MPNTNKPKTNWKARYEQAEEERAQLADQLREAADTLQIVARDKAQVERELSATRTRAVAAEMQRDQILEAIQSAQQAGEGDEDETGELADVIPITSPSDTE